MFANLELDDKIWDKIIREFDDNKDGKVICFSYFKFKRFHLMNLKK